MENTTVKDKKKTATTILGFAVIALVIIGLVSVIRFAVNTAKGLNKEDEQAAKYEEFLAPVIMNDPAAFDDVTRADQKQLISITIWSMISGEIPPDKYEYVDEGLLLPKTEVEANFEKLFGSDVVPTHTTVDGGEGVVFTYDETREAYIIPITGVSSIYKPDVVNISKKGTTIILTVGYLSSSEWVKVNDGTMTAPTPAKYMKISLREATDGESYYISAIQSAAANDYVTEASTSDTTAADETTAQADG